MALLDLVVSKRQVEAPGIVSLELKSAKADQLPPFTAGSHVDVHLPGGLVRQYSLCNSPRERDRYVLGVLKEVVSRGGSWAMHDLVVGETLQVSEPRNLFGLRDEAEHTVLLAGGIGVTPLLCMAKELAARGASFEMHYCTRSIANTAFRDEIATSSIAPHVRFHHDDGASGQQMSFPAVFASPALRVHVYVCGPTGFIDAALTSAQAHGWSPAQLHREYFTAPVEPSHDGGSFQVRILKTGQCIQIPENVTVMQALFEHGIEVPVSCEQGICGTCITRVVEGIPDHRDICMTDEEHARNDQFTPCCSRSRSPVLVIDL